MKFRSIYILQYTAKICKRIGRKTIILMHFQQKRQNPVCIIIKQDLQILNISQKRLTIRLGFDIILRQVIR